ncbi:MAG: acyltransferase [Oligoflexia bacterium]|jgi:hypothetical protein
MNRIPLPARLGLLGLNAVPLVHALGVLAPWRLLADSSWGWRLGWSLAVLYLLPPLLCRGLLLVFGRPPVRSSGFTGPFFVWWATSQLNALFIRFPALEEFLKLVPGVYSNWLRLWGARIGRLVYWGPRLQIMDRSFLEIGDDAMIGYGVGFTAHHVNRQKDGVMELVLASPKVGARAILGGLSGLTPGAEVAEGEMLPSTMGLAPFYFWKSGRRVKGEKYLGT